MKLGHSLILAGLLALSINKRVLIVNGEMVIFELERIFVFFTVERRYLPSLSHKPVSLGKQLKNLLVGTEGRAALCLQTQVSGRASS